VAAVILIEDRLLLVRQSKGGPEYYLLPGGGVRRGETLEAALVREVAEETGLTCRIMNPLFINDTIDPTGRRHLVNITFLAVRTGGELGLPASDAAVLGYTLVTRDQLAGLDLRPPVGEALLESWAEDFTGCTRYLGSIWSPE
jgi:ADP-ribose pyrophosphatase YjhB (NUDIX family)